MNRGWIRLYRKSWDNELFFKEIFTKWQAWVDLLLLANYEDRTFFLRGNKVTVTKGELAISEAELSKRWKWTRNRTRRFLFYLKNDLQIAQQKSNVINRIKIINYDLYQPTIQVAIQQKAKNDTTNGTTNDTTILKKGKEVKNYKNTNKTTTQPKTRFGEFKNVLITKKEHENLLKTYGKANTEKVITEMDIYIGSTGKYYKSHYLAMLGFIRRRPADYPMPEEKAEDMIDIMKKGSKLK